MHVCFALLVLALALGRDSCHRGRRTEKGGRALDSCCLCAWEGGREDREREARERKAREREAKY